MARKNAFNREEEKQEMSEEEGDEQSDEDGQSESEAGNHPGKEEPRAIPDAKQKNGKKSRKQQRQEELKSKATGVGLKISLDENSTPSNNKIVFDDTNLPTNNDDDSDEEEFHSAKEELSPANSKEEDDDDDAVEEVQGKTARDEVLDQMKTEAQQSLKSKKKRNRKPRIEKKKVVAPTESDDDDSDEDEEMDDDFFAQLESAREAELEKKRELEKSLTRAKGKHTTFIFEKNKDDMETTSDPIQVDENIQVVVLKDPSSMLGMTDNAISRRALMYSRNSLKDGSDRMAGEVEMKRQRNRSGEEIHPWKRARTRLTIGRSRLKKGKPSGSFKRNRR